MEEKPVSEWEDWEREPSRPPNYVSYRDDGRVKRRYVVFWIDDQDLSYLMKPGSLRFETYWEAERYIREELQCPTCQKDIDQGLDPRATCCYSLAYIWSERRLRRDLNDAWYRGRLKQARRQFDPKFRTRRKR
jgi:hypothetical protein